MSLIKRIKAGNATAKEEKFVLGVFARWKQGTSKPTTDESMTEGDTPDYSDWDSSVQIYRLDDQPPKTTRKKGRGR